MASAGKYSTSHTLKIDTHCVGVIKRLRSRPDLCDVVLIAGNSGKRISAHRSILIACSDYFAALLSRPTRESKEQEITLNDVDGDVLEILVEFCYTGNLELREDNIEAVLATADYLQFTEIFDQTSSSMELAFCVLLNFETLPDKAMKIVCKNFQAISNDPRFLLLNVKQMTQIIASEDLCVPSEEFVFRVLMKWIDYDPCSRKEHFSDLLSKIRLPLLTTAFLTETVQPLCNTTESIELVVNALKCQVSTTLNNATKSRNYKSKSVVKQLVVVSPLQENFVIAWYDLHTNKWMKFHTKTSHCGFFAAALRNDNLIIVDGLNGNTRTSTVRIINLVTMTTTIEHSLAAGRSFASVVLLRDSIYICGGYDGSAAINSVAKLDTDSGKWSYVAPMIEKRTSQSAVVINNYLYVSGGIGADGKRLLSSVECYDPVKNCWIFMRSMEEGRSSHGLAAYKDFLLAVAGEDSSGAPISTIERYNPDTNKWTEISSTPTISGYTKCVSLGPDLFLFNEGKFYTVDSDDDCEDLKLQIIPELDDFYPSRVEMFAIPYEFINTEGWIRNS